MGELVPHLKYGVPKSDMRKSLTSSWVLLGDEIAACQSYYLLKWSGKYFKTKNRTGAIFHQDIIYLICYNHCTPEEITQDCQVYLSFRKAHKEYNLPGYVLVSIADKRPKEKQIKQCPATMCGEYNPLRCCRNENHSGEHNWVVDGQYNRSMKS